MRSITGNITTGGFNVRWLTVCIFTRFSDQNRVWLSSSTARHRITSNLCVYTLGMVWFTNAQCTLITNFTSCRALVAEATKAQPTFHQGITAILDIHKSKLPTNSCGVTGSIVNTTLIFRFNISRERRFVNFAPFISLISQWLFHELWRSLGITQIFGHLQLLFQELLKRFKWRQLVIRS